MTPLQWIQVLAALASAMAAGLAWALRGGAGGSDRNALQAAQDREALLAAKDQELAALRRERDALRELTPLRIREFLVGARNQLKTYCQRLEETYAQARRDLAHCEAELDRRQAEAAWDAEAARSLILQRERLTAATQAMKAGLRELQHQSEYPDPVQVKLPAVNPAAIEQLTAQCLALSGPSESLLALSRALQQTFRYRLDENALFSETPFSRPEPGPAPEGAWQRPDNGE